MWKKIGLILLFIALNVVFFAWLNKNDSPRAVDIKIEAPQANAVVKNLSEIRGKAKGTWYFEGSFPVKVVDANGIEIGGGLAMALGDWMTEEYVDFKGTVEFAEPETGTGVMEFRRDNPSGLPEHDKKIKVPIKFEKPKTMAVRVYFGNKIKNPTVEDCTLAYQLERKVEPTMAIARAAINELLKGPTAEEQKDGYYSSINPGVTLLSIKIEDGTAYVDFDKKLEEAVGGSCRTAAIRSEITNTLKQFYSVKEVVISVEGRIEDALQP